MINKLKLLLVAMIIFFSNAVFANNMFGCDTDVKEMWDQIYTYGALTTADSNLITGVKYTGDSGSKCSAIGMKYGFPYCRLYWDVGNWGDTLVCDR